MMSLKTILILIGIAVIGLALIYGPKAIRVNKMIHLYDKDKIAFNFINMDKIFRAGPMIKASATPHSFQNMTKEFSLPSTFKHLGKDENLEDALEYYETDGLIVLKNNNLLYENYWHNNTQTSKHISWSMAKSFLSAIIGIAVDQGLIESIDDPVTKYLDDFKGTGYEGVPIKDLLQMSSGIKFNEDYADYNSDINRFGRTISFGTSMRDFAKSLENEKEPGTYHHYVSIDTQMLAMVLQEVTGKSVTESLQEHIWNKIGMQDDAYYMVDDSGMEVALGGLNATLRDYAKFGLLYLNRGDWNGHQVVPAEWVDASHATDEDHLVPGDNPNSSSVWGYGYQWWVPGFPSTEYTASGVYNQYIFIDPENKIVIAKTSSNHRFTAEKEESKAAHVAMFRAIASAAANL